MQLLPCISQHLFMLTQAPGALRFFRSFQKSKTIQEAILFENLQKNQGTAFGKEHDFRHIRNIDTYRKKIPIRHYPDFLPYIESIKTGQQGVLTAEKVHCFQPTGGSTGTKLIPYTRSLAQEFRNALAPWFLNIARHFPTILGGKTYWSITPPGNRIKRLQDQATEIGFEDDTAYFGWKGLFLLPLLAAPPWITQIQHIQNFRFLTLYFLLRAKELRWISIWSPTFLLVLLEDLEHQADKLLTSLYDGGPQLPETEKLPVQIVRKPLRARAKELEKLFLLPAAERYRKIWPNLAFISLWQDAYAQHSAQQLEKFFKNVFFQGKGLLATEGVTSIPLQYGQNSHSTGHVPAFTSHFLEFFSEAGEAKCLWELQEGQIYSVILTTGGGLYRYNTGDLLRVEGWYHTLPLLRFLGRKGRYSDLAGEKLEEKFVAGCLQQVLHTVPFSYSFLLVAPEEWKEKRGYTLFIESVQPTRVLAFSKKLETAFRENIHYKFAVNMGQISPLRVFLIKKDGHRTYLKRCMEEGQQLGDIKPLAFDIRTGWKEHFEGKYLKFDYAMSASNV